MLSPVVVYCLQSVTVENDYLSGRMAESRAEAIRSAGTPRWAAVVLRHPVSSAFVLLVVVFAFQQFVPRVMLSDLDGSVYSREAGELIGEGLSALLVAVIILALGWWRAVGLAGPVSWGSVWLAWFPLLAVIVLFAVQAQDSQVSTDAKWLGLALPNMFLVGFFEEALTRGLVLFPMLAAWRSRPNGVMAAVLISSLLFGLVHLINLFNGAAPAPTLVQVGYAVGFGVGFAALLLRTNTMWLGIVLHALVDANSEAWFGPPGGSSDADGGAVSLAPLLLIGLPFLVYGLVLIRRRKVKDASLPVVPRPVRDVQAAAASTARRGSHRRPDRERCEPLSPTPPTPPSISIGAEAG